MRLPEAAPAAAASTVGAGATFTTWHAAVADGGVAAAGRPLCLVPPCSRRPLKMPFCAMRTSWPCWTEATGAVGSRKSRNPLLARTPRCAAFAGSCELHHTSNSLGPPASRAPA